MSSGRLEEVRDLMRMLDIDQNSFASHDLQVSSPSTTLEDVTTLGTLDSSENVRDCISNRHPS